MSGHDEAKGATWALSEPSVWQSPDARSIPTLLAAIGQVLADAEAKVAARKVAAVEALADEFAQRAVVYESHPEHDTDRYLDGFATAMRVAEKWARAALATGGDQ